MGGRLDVGDRAPASTTRATSRRNSGARLVLPANSGGLKPVTDRMDDFVRENHPDLDACFTESLALETVEGPREYKLQTK